MATPRPIHESAEARYKEYSSVPKRTNRRRHSNQPQTPSRLKYQATDRRRYQSQQSTHSLTKTKTLRAKKRKLRAIRAGWLIGATLTPWYAMQFILALVFFISVGAAKSEGFIAWLTRDLALAFMGVAWILEIALGSLFLGYAIVVFSSAKIRIFSQPKILIIFAVCLWGYWAPFLFFFPWIYVFIWAVINAQK